MTTTEQPPGPGTRRRPLHLALLTVIAVGLVVLGGGLAVALGIGRTAQPTADSADAGFARDMSIHHLQAVEMANLALERSEDPAIRGLAFDIAESQNNQVGRMQGWLSLWGIPPSGGERMSWMGDAAHAGHDMPEGEMAGGHAAGAAMPGMATEQELAELRSLSGEEFDVEFLRLMIRHHQGGYDMARYADEHAQESVVRSLARAIAESQSAETEAMTSLLTERGGSPLPAP